MSTDYVATRDIPFEDLKKLDLARDGVGWKVSSNDPAPEDKAIVLTDGENYLWAYNGKDGNVSAFVRYMPNGDPGYIRDFLFERFGVVLISEHEQVDEWCGPEDIGPISTAWAEERKLYWTQALEEAEKAGDGYAKERARFWLAMFRGYDEVKVVAEYQRIEEADAVRRRAREAGDLPAGAGR